MGYYETAALVVVGWIVTAAIIFGLVGIAERFRK